MGARDNILAFGLQSLVAFSSPVFAGASGRTANDYFLEAGEYLGKGFAQARHEAQEQHKEKQLDLSTQDLADHCRVSRRTVEGWEQSRMPTAAALNVMASLLTNNP